MDDEPRGVTSLQKLLEYNCPEVEVIATCGDALEAKEKIDSLKPQLVFLDIAMPVINAFDLLKDLAPVKFETIFVTAHENYMLQAFRFSAVDYLLKPVKDKLLVEAVQRASQKISEKNAGNNLETLLYNLHNKEGAQKMKLCIPSVKGLQMVNISDIIYCEGSNNYTNIYFKNRPFICSSKLIHEYESLLEDSNFVRVHKSYLVNLEHVKEYIRGEGGSVLLSNEKYIEVSRRKKEHLMTRLKDFFKF